MKNAIGRNTTTAIQAGIFFGYVGLVDNIVEKMIEESGEQNVLSLQQEASQAL